MIRRVLAAGSIFALTACVSGGGGTAAPGRDGGAAAPSAELGGGADAARWVDSTLASLSLREKVGQMVMPWMGGGYLSVGSPEHERLAQWVEEEGVGGLIISIGPPLEVASRSNLLQAMADVPLLIATDMEHGPGQRLDAGYLLPWASSLGSGTVFPPVMGLGAAGDPELAYEMGRITAVEARAAGIHWTFAPVVDVNNNPDNPIINVRSYGEEPGAVARLASAHIRGLRDHGLLATAKHFPGHGDVETDSHIAAPVLRIDRARADSVELVPFRAAIDAGVDAVMSAHIVFPELTGDATRPATLSPAALDGLLRRELGFEGLIVTDAMDMGGVLRNFTLEEAAVMAVKAGADVVLQPPSVAAVTGALVAAVERGEIAEPRIDGSVRRILEAKARLGLHRSRTVELDAVPGVVGREAHREVGREAARRSITVPRDRAGLLPIDTLGVRRPLSLIYSDEFDPRAGRALHASLGAALPELETATITARTDGAALDSILALAVGRDLVLFSAFVGYRAGKGTIALPEPVATRLRGLLSSPATVVASFGNPYLLRQLPDAGTYLLAWSGSELAQEAAADALLGRSRVTGVLPISIPPMHEVGDGLSPERKLSLVEPGAVGMDAGVLERLDRRINDLVNGGASPGVALAVGRKGRLVRLRGYGRLDPRPGFGPATASTIYDLASLTKVVATTTAAMILVDEGRLELDAPLSRYLEDWDGGDGQERVTIRQLLTHTAGLPPYKPLWRELRGREAYLRRITSLALDREPGTRTVYSDLGLVLVGAVVETITGQRLDRFLEERVFAPLEMDDTGFIPLPVAAASRTPSSPAGPAANGSGSSVAVEGGGAGRRWPLERIAPTELDTVFRDTHVHGVVHDENAYAMGGVAGHAGLFSSARDLAVFAQLLLEGGSWRGRAIFDGDTLERFTRRQNPGSTRALGWNTADRASSLSAMFSDGAFGHTGFTGTSLWVDPERELFVVILTNRVNPTRSDQRIGELRRVVHELVVESILSP